MIRQPMDSQVREIMNEGLYCTTSFAVSIDLWLFLNTPPELGSPVGLGVKVLSNDTPDCVEGATMPRPCEGRVLGLVLRAPRSVAFIGIFCSLVASA